MNKPLLSFNQELIKRSITAVILATGFVIGFVFAPPYFVSLVLLLMLYLILRYEWPLFKLNALTLLYPAGPFFLLILLNHTPQRILLLVLFLIVGSYEAGAYGVGKLIGKHKLWPSISPGKTWEGFIGGYIISMITTLAIIPLKSNYMPALAGATFLVLSATIGDLFESYLKRRVHIKDSGSLLPGHGGILDRFDGVLGAILVLYPCRAWFIQLFRLPW